MPDTHPEAPDLAHVVEQLARIESQLIDRCRAAHPEDSTACVGVHDAVMVLDRAGAGVTGCEHHGTRILASLSGARVLSGPSTPGAAIRVHRAASAQNPFPWLNE